MAEVLGKGKAAKVSSASETPNNTNPETGLPANSATAESSIDTSNRKKLDNPYHGKTPEEMRPKVEKDYVYNFLPQFLADQLEGIFADCVAKGKKISEENLNRTIKRYIENADPSNRNKMIEIASKYRERFQEANLFTPLEVTSSNASDQSLEKYSEKTSKGEEENQAA